MIWCGIFLVSSLVLCIFFFGLCLVMVFFVVIVIWMVLVCIFFVLLWMMVILSLLSGILRLSKVRFFWFGKRFRFLLVRMLIFIVRIFGM